MSTLQEQLARLRNFKASIRKGDGEAAEEGRDLEAVSFEAMPSPEAIEDAVELESIIMRRERPVLAIFENVTKLKFKDKADSKIWGARLKAAKSLLDAAIPSVGRINLTNASMEWVGTGWLVHDNIMVTNRHVAAEFVTRKGDGFTFQMGSDERIAADADFLQEIDNDDTLVFRLAKPLYVSDIETVDVAFFEIDTVSGDQKLARPIKLAKRVEVASNVAAIGYPAFDSRIPDTALMERIYGSVYNKKRLAPGGVTRVEATRLLHNCTTLGGNSGSVILDLDKGEALGLHFSGSFLKTNYAVRADVVQKLLDEVRGGRTVRRAPSPAREKPAAVSVDVGQAGGIRPMRATGVVQGVGASATITVPLTLTVSLGTPGQQARPARYRPAAGGSDDEDLLISEEAVAEDYSDRQGYAADFLGEAFSIDLPRVKRGARDVLTFESPGEGEQRELRYEHFSVVMSRSRRMCFLSACNIDGQLSKKSARVGWKWDPRIPRELQIMKECYGNPPKFSRGHMTRREDPGWGDAGTSKRGNEDSMHVTNATPQMQAFNAPIWLALEDYALEHAREDDMKISVFTGPYFAEDDPQMYGVRIPTAFWKIIAFIHDETGELSATGYEMDQRNSLQPEEEFVFGQFTSPQLGTATQVPISTIESRAGIDFGSLVDADPLADGEESIAAGPRAPLLAMQQIRFTR